MFPIAGQTAGPIGLKFFGDTHGWPGVSQAKIEKKISTLFFKIFLFHRQRRPLQLVENIYRGKVRVFTGGMNIFRPLGLKRS